MFTGIIQDVGHVAEIRREPEQAHMLFATHLDMSGWALGDSVAVDGCCLTVTRFEKGMFAATLSAETLQLTVFGEAEEGRRVNLEPALKLGDALGGHMVSGHVDGMGEVIEVANLGEHVRMRFRLSPALARYVVKKGSVAINGVSLTVNEVDGCDFSVNLIPHTLAHTNLDELAAGDKVNIETDMLGRYVERLLQFSTEKA
ncbi:MAG TPA: riboflavin synthase [Mariprofundaceae bacterium]|nr:riboflavin synthase [Mariprofundaceae bacterium]